MKRYKVMVYIFLVMCALLAGGCGQGESVNKAAQEPTKDEVTWAELYCDVDWWHPSAWSTKSETVTGNITEKTGVALKTIIPLRDADKQLSLMLLNGELPDLISVVDPTVTGQVVSSGKVWNLDEFLEKYCPDSHLLSQFPEDMKQALIKRDGAWYAYPSHINSGDARKIWMPCDSYYQDIVNYSDNNAIMWNRSLLEQLGISADELSTETQVMNAWKKAKDSGLTVNGKAVIPLLVDGSEYWDPTVKYLQYSFGAEYIDEEGNYRDILLSSESKHALYFLNKAYRNGCWYAEQLNYTNEVVKQRIAAGNVLCFIGNIANTNLDAANWVSTGAILSSQDKTPVLGKNMQAGTGWIQTFISKTCKEPQKIAQFLDYMTSEEGMLAWYFGQEGEHYSIREDGLIVQSEEQAALKSAYDETNLDEWWMFENTSWIRSVLAPPQKSSQLAQEDAIKIAFGKDAHTVVYDSSALELYSGLPADSAGLEEMEKKLSGVKEEQIARVVLAESEVEFEAEHEKMLNALRLHGIEEVDAEKNRIFQDNQQAFGSRLEKINE